MVEIVADEIRPAPFFFLVFCVLSRFYGHVEVTLTARPVNNLASIQLK